MCNERTQYADHYTYMYIKLYNVFGKSRRFSIFFASGGDSITTLFGQDPDLAKVIGIKSANAAFNCTLNP